MGEAKQYLTNIRVSMNKPVIIALSVVNVLILTITQVFTVTYPDKVLLIALISSIFLSLLNIISLSKSIKINKDIALELTETL